MIDHVLIDSASRHAATSFANRTTTSCPYVWTVDDFFEQPLLQKLLTIAADNTQPWRKLELQEYTARVCLDWIPDSVIEETYDVVRSITPLMEDLIGHRLKFNGINLWKDQPSYHIGPHSDRNLIRVALQIYINFCDIDLTTHFDWQGKIIHPNNRANSGYIMDNSGHVRHWLANAVPQNFNRYSIYAIWQN